VPPDQVTVAVTLVDWPTSIPCGERVSVGRRARVIFTVVEAQKLWAGLPTLASVTWTE
jgi:hypothetical protein